MIGSENKFKKTKYKLIAKKPTEISQICLQKLLNMKSSKSVCQWYWIKDQQKNNENTQK